MCVGYNYGGGFHWALVSTMARTTALLNYTVQMYYFSEIGYRLRQLMEPQSAQSGMSEHSCTDAMTSVAGSSLVVESSNS